MSENKSARTITDDEVRLHIRAHESGMSIEERRRAEENVNRCIAADSAGEDSAARAVASPPNDLARRAELSRMSIEERRAAEANVNRFAN